MYKVLVLSPKGPIAESDYDKDVCMIGRDEGNDIVLPGWTVARKHAELQRRPEGVFIRDAGSLPGTLVNGERISCRGPLKPTDEVRIGACRIYVHARLASDDMAAEDGVALFVAVPPAEQTIPSVSPQALPPPVQQREEWVVWRRKIHQDLVRQMDLRRTDVSRMSEEELRKATAALIQEILSRIADLPVHLDREHLADAVLNEAIGLGPLEELLADEAVTEIMVNRFDEIFVERQGRLEKTPVCFASEQGVMDAIDRIVAPLGRRIDESSPMVDARLKDGSRVNAVIPPLALRGPSITIRKFPKSRLGVDDLIRFGSLSEEMAAFLRIAVEQHRNVVVSGGTGTGKTTLLNVLSNNIPDEERIVTIEDAAELRLHQPNLVTLEARPANLEGRGQVSIRDLVRNSLRMRPDRIVVGECRGGEALDMLQAMNTGHDGSLTTAHANTPRDLLSRLEVMVLMAGMDLPVAAIREQIAAAIHIIVQQTRFSCGSRKITHICEVTGVEGNVIQLQDLFVFRQEGFDRDGRVRGHFHATGAIPEFYEELARHGIPVDYRIFQRAERVA